MIRRLDLRTVSREAKATFFVNQDNTQVAEVEDRLCNDHNRFRRGQKPQLGAY